MAFSAIPLTTFVGLPQRFGSMLKATIQVLIKVAVSEDRDESQRLRVQENIDLTDSTSEKNAWYPRCPDQCLIFQPPQKLSSLCIASLIATQS